MSLTITNDFHGLSIRVHPRGQAEIDAFGRRRWTISESTYLKIKKALCSHERCHCGFPYLHAGKYTILRERLGDFYTHTFCYILEKF
jgi:hypothetical protein